VYDDRLSEIAESAESAALGHDFRTLARRGRRRRQASALAAGAAAVLVASVVVVGVRGVYVDQSAPVHPVAPSPSPTAESPTRTTASTAVPVSQLTAEQIVQDPDAELLAMVVAGDDSNVRASMWALCIGRSCRGHRWALAVTADAFTDTHYVKVGYPSPLVWAGGQDFVVESPSSVFSLVDTEGGVQPLAVSGTSSPLAADETLTTVWHGNTAVPYAVDAFSGTAHPVRLPDAPADVTSMNRQGPTLWGLADVTTTVVSSPDGGATWRAPYQLPKGSLYSPVASGDPSTKPSSKSATTAQSSGGSRAAPTMAPTGKWFARFSCAAHSWLGQPWSLPAISSSTSSRGSPTGLCLAGCTRAKTVAGPTSTL